MTNKPQTEGSDENKSICSKFIVKFAMSLRRLFKKVTSASSSLPQRDGSDFYDAPFRDYDANGNLVHEYTPEKGFIDYTHGGTVPPIAPENRTLTDGVVHQFGNTIVYTTAPGISPGVQHQSQLQQRFEQCVNQNLPEALIIATEMVQKFPKDPIGYHAMGKVYQFNFKPSQAAQCYAQGWERTQNSQLLDLHRKFSPSSRNDWISTKMAPFVTDIFQYLSRRDLLRSSAVCIHWFEMLLEWQPFWNKIITDQFPREFYQRIFARQLEVLRLRWTADLEDVLLLMADMCYYLEEFGTFNAPNLVSNMAFDTFLKKCGRNIQQMTFDNSAILPEISLGSVPRYCTKLKKLSQMYMDQPPLFPRMGLANEDDIIPYLRKTPFDSLHMLQISVGQVIDRRIIVSIIRHSTNLRILALDPNDYVAHDVIISAVTTHAHRLKWFLLTMRAIVPAGAEYQPFETEPHPQKGLYRVAFVGNIRVRDTTLIDFFKSHQHTLETIHLPNNGGFVLRSSLAALCDYPPPNLRDIDIFSSDERIIHQNPAITSQMFGPSLLFLMNTCKVLHSVIICGNDLHQNIVNLSDPILMACAELKHLQYACFLNCLNGPHLTHKGLKKWSKQVKDLKTLIVDCRIFRFLSLELIVRNIKNLERLSVWHPDAYVDRTSQSNCYCGTHGVSMRSQGDERDGMAVVMASRTLKVRGGGLHGFDSLLTYLTGRVS
ncbi:hypothetical protein BJV82DRAFT_609415, partial [Fennellomyces sp. T-0311]